MQQFEEISKAADFRAIQIWVGGLLNAEAYITATRQSAAQSHGWSLENLRLFAEKIAVKTPGSASTSHAIASDPDGFTVRGLALGTLLIELLNVILTIVLQREHPGAETRSRSLTSFLCPSLLFVSYGATKKTPPKVFTTIINWDLLTNSLYSSNSRPRHPSSRLFVRDSQ